MPGRKLFPRLRLDWPLLGKELLEQAARKQMYVIRVVYALVLFGAFCVYYMRHLAGGPVLAMGRGLGPFDFLVTAQLVTIFLFLPPLMAGALAQEKERETLGLLFLTDLTPWELILQKYVRPAHSHADSPLPVAPASGRRLFLGRRFRRHAVFQRRDFVSHLPVGRRAGPGMLGP